VTVIYPEFRDFCEIAADILGSTPEQIGRLPNVGVAESAIAAPSAGFGETDAYPTLLEKAAVLLDLTWLSQRTAQTHTPEAERRAGSTANPSSSTS
jgi:hypothetical protein